MKQISYSEESINEALHILDNLNVKGFDNMNSIMSVFNILTSKGTVIEKDEESEKLTE